MYHKRLYLIIDQRSTYCLSIVLCARHTKMIFWDLTASERGSGRSGVGGGCHISSYKLIIIIKCFVACVVIEIWPEGWRSTDWGTNNSENVQRFQRDCIWDESQKISRCLPMQRRGEREKGLPSRETHLCKDGCHKKAQYVQRTVSYIWLEFRRHRDEKDMVPTPEVFTYRKNRHRKKNQAIKCYLH